MPVIGAKLSESDLIALNRLLESIGYDTLGEFLRDFARNKVKLASSEPATEIA